MYCKLVIINAFQFLRLVLGIISCNLKDHAVSLKSSSVRREIDGKLAPVNDIGGDSSSVRA